MLVFLVDDDNEDHEIFEMAFSKAFPDYIFVTAENGIEAIDKFKKDPDFSPDIIFLDVNMPRMNGKDCIRELRKMPALSATPMILYSTHDSQKEVAEAKLVGASDFMTKPASIPAYTVALHTMVSKHLNLK